MGKTDMNEAVIGIGSNIKPRRHIRKVRRLIRREFQVIRESRPMKTKAVGYTLQPDFINLTVRVTTKKDRKGLVKWLKQTEDDLGRIRTQNKYGPRTMDLDLLVWNGDIVDNDVFSRDFLRQQVREIWP